MDKKDKFEKESISKAQYEDPSRNIVNDDIEVIPYQGASIGEEIAVTYGPDPMLIEEVSSNEESDIVFVDVDSDMYGGSLPEDFYRENLELTELTNEGELIVEESTESDDKDNEKKSDLNYLDCDDFIC